MNTNRVPAVRVIDTHRLARKDPNGMDIYCLMLVATLFGFLTIFQIRANAPGLSLRCSAIFVIGVAVLGSLALALVGGDGLHGFSGAGRSSRRSTSTRNPARYLEPR
jgi:hypothetical protein